MVENAKHFFSLKDETGPKYVYFLCISEPVFVDQFNTEIDSPKRQQPFDGWGADDGWWKGGRMSTISDFNKVDKDGR